MKRDWDLVRKILILTAERQDSDLKLASFDITGYEDGVVAYHFRFMQENSFISVTDTSTLHGEQYVDAELEDKGEELLRIIKSDEQWDDIKELIKRKELNMTLNNIKLAVLTL